VSIQFSIHRLSTFASHTFAQAVSYLRNLFFFTPTLNYSLVETGHFRAFQEVLWINLTMPTAIIVCSQFVFAGLLPLLNFEILKDGDFSFIWIFSALDSCLIHPKGNT
jgi:hypothetical protein